MRKFISDDLQRMLLSEEEIRGHSYVRVVSLFSGAGGLDLGLIQAGHKVVWANDYDGDAVETYRRNIGNHVVHARIEDVPSNEIPECDVVVGGFPCQGFSQANMLRFEEDERNRLYLEFIRILRDKQPTYFLAENVRGILSLAGGSAIERIHRDLERCGYRVKKQLFNVADFGVPQNRWRVIIAGTRVDLPESLAFDFPTATHGKNGSRTGVQSWVSIGKALSKIPEPEDNHDLRNHVYSKYKITNRNFTGHRTTNPARPSPTILARGNGKGGVCAIQHPLNHRRMSIRESATVQTFPTEFEFFGAMNSCYRQVGNAVPVLFAKHLGEKLAELEYRRQNLQAGK